MKRLKTMLVSLVIALVLCSGGCIFETSSTNGNSTVNVSSTQSSSFDLSSVPAYSGSTYVEINNNIPEFDETDFTTESFEYYSDLDELGRCGVAYANIGQDLMPTGERGDISSVHPTGWHSAKYDCVEQEHLYNRSHLIAYCLAGENANEKNLITGTRYMNAEGMNQFEIEVSDYVHSTNNHVLYRVTPIFEGDNLVASGVRIEAESVEDKGEGIKFNVYCYNVQPGVCIDYSNGDSWLEDESDTNSLDGDTAASKSSEENTYIINTSSGKFHYPDCDGIKNAKAKNKKTYTGSRYELINEGYEPCGNCNP